MTELLVNGRRYSVEVSVGRTLAETLREDVGLTGTKIACGEGHCGACTVLLDGTPVLSCITLVHTVDGREVTTIEGLRDHALVGAFVRADALQCGFCTPGQIASARDGGEHLPLRRVPEDRGGDPHVARLIVLLGHVGVCPRRGRFGQGGGETWRD